MVDGELLPQRPLPTDQTELTLQQRTEVDAQDLPDDEQATHPVGYLTVEPSDADRHLLETWVWQHLDQIEKEMADVTARLENERRQYEGTMPAADYPYPGAFRINYPVTKKKSRELSNRAKQAFLDSDPIWAVDVGGHDEQLSKYAQRLEKSMDDLVRDQLEVVTSLSQALFESSLHGTGCLVPDWRYQEDVRRDVETYKGFDGIDPNSLRDLMEFEKNYPEWKDDKALRSIHVQLAKGETVTKEFTYTLPVQNHPVLSYISIKDARVYPETEGFEGLRTTPVYGYLRKYTRAQMRQFVKDETIEANQWERVLPGQQDDEQLDPKSEQEPHEVFHATIRYQLSEDDRPVRYKVWLERKSKVILRLRAFPWWYHEPDLIPLYTGDESPGFFKPGLAWDLKDDHIVLNVLMNMYLNGVDLANSMRFKAKERSPGYAYILARKWSPHVPIPYKDSGDEVQQFGVETGHLQSLVESIELMRRNTDEGTGTSALQSGRESPTDKRAPATKSLLLLQQVEPTLKEHLRSLEPGMKQAGKWILWLYYQGIALNWLPNFPGMPDIPHELLPQLAEKLQPRALLFEFDRVNRVETNLAVMKIVAEMFPQDLPVVARIAISQMNSQWARSVDQLKLQLPPPPPPPGAAPGTNGAAQPASATPGNGAPPMDGRLAELAQMRRGQG